MWKNINNYFLTIKKYERGEVLQRKNRLKKHSTVYIKKTVLKL
jgi:hypothetical protein